MLEKRVIFTLFFCVYTGYFVYICGIWRLVSFNGSAER